MNVSTQESQCYDGHTFRDGGATEESIEKVSGWLVYHGHTPEGGPGEVKKELVSGHVGL
jgi:hypothetical protein